MQEDFVKQAIRFNLNDKPIRLTVDTDRKLLWVLRTDLTLTGTKYGCGGGFCGACTVLVNNEAVRSCQTSVKDVQEKNVFTIEGLEQKGNLHPLQQAFMENDALQCGYCTSGMIMNATAFLRTNRQPTSSQISDWMDSNLCRCGAHTRIVHAIESASKTSKGEL